MDKNKDNEQILSSIAKLTSNNGNRTWKYNRNLRKYYNSNLISIEDVKSGNVVGIFQANRYGENNTGLKPSINVIKSCTDTLVSKISQSKVRPFFNTVNGDWKDIQAAKQAQQYFDMFFDQENVHKTVTDCFRDACIFDTGVIYIDTEEKRITRALPWQVYIDAAEKTYGHLYKLFYERTKFPVSALPDKIKKEIKNKALTEVNYGIYWDIENQIKVYTANRYILLIEPYKLSRLPFVWLYYDNPVQGISSTSVADILYSIQQDIDVVSSKIHDSMVLSPGNLVFVPEGTGVSSGQISNRNGNIYTFRATPNGTTPVQYVAPPVIDPQNLQILTDLINRAYELIGISQLSAQSKKPAGLDSGIALATMEDVESERFEVQLTQVIYTYVNIAKICIMSFAEEDDILPETNTRLGIKWKDVVKASKNMNIQYSAADSLSKDPSTKLQQLQALAQMGIISRTRLAQFMQLPDLEGGYSIAQDALNAVNVVIMDCLEHDNYDIPDYIPFDLLKEEILHTQLTLKASNSKKNAEDIDKLTKLFESIGNRESDYMAETTGFAAEVSEDTNNNETPEAFDAITTPPAIEQSQSQAPAQNSDVEEMKMPLSGSPWNGPINKI